ncbi:MAG: PorP/SprF family type IX secretion system membrane protein [Bacteroidota bacterium]
MTKLHFIFLFLLGILVFRGQDVELPPDLRQHNLTEYNASLFSPVFSLDRNNPESIALWSRWQWQTIDGDPTTIFLNYTRRLDIQSAIGGGFFQHNTGVFLNTGGVLNYAYALNLKSNAQISFGINLFGFQQTLADDRFQLDPDIQLPQLASEDSFIVQFAPSLRFKLSGFNIGIVAENLFDYNFTASETQTRPEEKVYLGFSSYNFPLNLSGALEGAYLRPMVYLKTLPDADNQYGITTLFSTPKFWVQGGYNSFYGVSGGVGGRFFKKLSVGALIEYGIDSDLDDRDPTFEIVTAFSFGEQDMQKEIEDFEEEKAAEEEKIKEELEKSKALAEAQEQKRKEALRIQKEQNAKDSIAAIKKTQAVAAAERLAEQKRLDSINKARAIAQELRQQQQLDSINAAKIAEAEAAKREAEQQQIAAQKADDKPKAGEKYQEITSEDGLEPGYYLIANVFGTKKYFEKFMTTLKAKGLEPKSFYRSVNKFNYVYLKRYNTIQEARNARDSNFNGRYPDKTWIFRVVAN